MPCQYFIGYIAIVNENLTPFSKALNEEIAHRRGPSKRGLPTQEQIASAIARTQPYVSSRLNGEYPWTTNDIDLMAPLFNETAFSLIQAARERVQERDELAARRARVRGARQDRIVAYESDPREPETDGD